jgi:hypothetical protein
MYRRILSARLPYFRHLIFSPSVQYTRSLELHPNVHIHQSQEISEEKIECLACRDITVQSKIVKKEEKKKEERRRKQKTNEVKEKEK